MIRLAVLCSTLAVVMFGAAPAGGSLWVDFEPAEASPGDEVTATTVGQGAQTGALANVSPDNVVVLYLAAEHDEIDGPEDSKATRVGKLEIDQAGHGRLTFTVPDINPGTYVAYLHCQDCSFDAQGLSFAAAGSFDVAQVRLPDTGAMSSEVFAAGTALLLAGVVIAATSKQARSQRAL